MHIAKCASLVVALCLGWGGLTAFAGEGRPGGDKPLPAANGAGPNGPRVDPEIGGVVQGVVQDQETIVVTGTVQGGPIGLAPRGTLIDNNGVREFQDEEYGKKIKIIDDSKNGITIECLSRKGGTDETKKYNAKDLADLEKKHPEGFKLYQQYLGNQAALPVAGGVILNAVPVGPGQPIPAPGGGIHAFQIGPVEVQVQGQAIIARPGGGAVPIEAAAEIMRQLNQDIQSAAKNGSWKGASKESKAALKKQAAELKTKLSELEKQFEEK